MSPSAHPHRPSVVEELAEAVRSAPSQPDEGYPEAPPELSELDELRATVESQRYMIERARWALGTDEPINERLQEAEMRAAVAEREAAAYREQVQALIRSNQRERGVPEETLGDGEAFVVLNDREQGMTEERVREIIGLELGTLKRTRPAGGQ